MPPLVPALLKAVPGLTLLHQAGARHAETTRAAYEASGADPARWRVEPFLDDMATQFASAHLVMARSGASTVAELAAAGKPSLLIPFAAAADNHQRSNAEVMVQAGASVMLEERQLGQSASESASSAASSPNPLLETPLLETLTSLLADPTRLQSMSEQARTQAHPGAAERIADRLCELIR